MIQFQEPQKAVEFSIYRGKNFSVFIRAWKSGDEFKWNVYACIFEGHPLFGNVDAMMCMPLHGGPTYDRVITQEPARGVEYDWQSVEKSYKIGSDYSHYQDNYENDSYDHGIPPMIRHDAEELAKHLFECEATITL